MDVYNFLQLATDISGIRVRVFDCTREDIVFDSKYYDNWDIAMEVDFQGFGDYEVLSYDLYKTMDGEVFLELNIEMDEEND